MIVDLDHTLEATIAADMALVSFVVGTSHHFLLLRLCMHGGFSF